MSSITIPNDKRYSKADGEKYDGPGKRVTVDFLTQAGFTDIFENLDESRRKFKRIWDIAGVHPETKEVWRVDCEIKNYWGTLWKEQPFRYETMDVPYRKRDKTEEHATHHILIGEDLKRLFLVKREAVINAPVSEKWVRNRRQNEPFFNIDIRSPDGAFWIKDDSGKWNIYKG